MSYTLNVHFNAQDQMWCLHRLGVVPQCLPFSADKRGRKSVLTTPLHRGDVPGPLRGGLQEEIDAGLLI